MSLVQPGARPQLMSSAFGRFSHVMGFVSLAGAFVAVLEFQSSHPSALLWPGLVALVLMAGSRQLLPRPPTSAMSVVYLILGAASVYVFALTVLSQSPAIRSTDAFPLSLAKTALILFGGSGLGARRIILWCCLGYVAAEGMTVAAANVAGASIRFDLSTFACLVALVIVLVTAVISNERLRTARPELNRAALDENVSQLRHGIEVKAAALLHDTVLSHLAAVGSAKDGPLDPRLKRHIERDLEILLDEEWLRDSPAEPEGYRGWHQSALSRAVDDCREMGLAVTISGDVVALGRLDGERDTAVGLAAKQCLMNVLQHAGTEFAEVVVVGAEKDIAVMIIDAGRGFERSTLPPDRLGLRQSVDQRIRAVGGEVRVWSTPDRGTSVILRVPARDAAAGADE